MSSPSPTSLHAEVTAALRGLRSKPFPSGTVPNAAYQGAFEACEDFVADTPRRLVAIVAERYFDPEQDGSPDAGLSPHALEAGYDQLFAEAVQAAQAHFGRPALAEPWSLPLDDEVHNFDRTQLACWVDGGRVLMVHYATQYGDGDVQLLLSVCAVPHDGAADGGGTVST